VKGLSAAEKLLLLKLPLLVIIVFEYVKKYLDDVYQAETAYCKNLFLVQYFSLGY
jgi:hypothetical protein